MQNTETLLSKRKRKQSAVQENNPPLKQRKPDDEVETELSYQSLYSGTCQMDGMALPSLSTKDILSLNTPPISG